jgi:hypothetical protein
VPDGAAKAGQREITSGELSTPLERIEHREGSAFVCFKTVYSVSSHETDARFRMYPDNEEVRRLDGCEMWTRSRYVVGCMEGIDGIREQRAEAKS